MMKRPILIVMIALLLLSAGIYFGRLDEGRQVRIGKKAYQAELAETEQAKALGLGERDALCPDCGMLFRFSPPSTPGFWMKGMRFPLDIIWIKGGKIIRIDGNVAPDSKETFFSPQPVDWVLEVNGGEAQLQGFRVGDEVEIR